MQISLNWLKELLPLEADADEIAEHLTMLGLEIEAVRRPGQDIENVFVGRILDIQPHPEADKLVVCRTDAGQGEALQIICGATNMKVGDKVPTAIDGATLPGGFKIGSRKMRGIQSCGMMCSARELGLGEEHAGLLILDKNAPIGQDIRDFLGLNDVVFEIEVTPNRGDWASMIGVARELAAFYGLQMTLPDAEVKESGEPAAAWSSITIEAPDLCPRYAGRILRNVVIKPSPPWLCARLIAAGQRPINNVVDITNYILMETGHPLHAFDYEKLKENRIVVRRARADEKITTLDGTERQLQEDMLVIADAENAQAVAGIMGGADSEVEKTTTTILLESAWFESRCVRSTSRRLSLSTEASQRFQRGADMQMLPYALNRAARLMQELADAEVAPGILDAWPQQRAYPAVTLRYERTVSRVGVNVAPAEQKRCLVSLGCELESETDASATFKIPSWRHDIRHEADLIEEVARLFGYENIPVTMPPVRQAESVFAPHATILRNFRRYLAGQGLTEVMNWSFGSPEGAVDAGLPVSPADQVYLSNPLSENYAVMRFSLLPGLFGTAAYNAKRGRRDLRIFELGPVYRNSADEILPAEPMYAGILLSGNAPGHWSRAECSYDFYDIKGCLDVIARFFGKELTLEESASSGFQKGQFAEIKWRKHILGCIGKVADEVVKTFGLPENTYVLEINLEILLAKKTEPAQFTATPQYPASLRDLAVVVDRAVPAKDLVAATKQAAGPLLTAVNVFDVYSGKPLPSDKKSIALSLLFQSPDRTLTDKDTQKTMDRIVSRLRKDFEAELR